MVSLRTLLLWLAVAVLVVTTVVTLWIALGETLHRPQYVSLPLFLASLATLFITVIALKRGIDDDHRQLGEYESLLFRRVKPLLLFVSAALSGTLAVYLGVVTPGAIEVESCVDLTPTGGARLEHCTTDHQYGMLVLIAPFFISALLIAVSSAGALIRDVLDGRAAAAHSH